MWSTAARQHTAASSEPQPQRADAPKAKHPRTATHTLISTQLSPDIREKPSDYLPPTPPRDAAERTAGALRVLIIDTDPVSLQRHTSFVAHIPHFEVAEASASVSSGAHLMLQHPPQHDLVILSITHPNGTGLNLMRQLRARGICTPVLITSSVRTPEIVHLALAMGAIDFLITPIGFTLFAQRLRQARRYCEQRTAQQNSRKSAATLITQQEIDEVLASHHPRVCSSRHAGLAPDTLQLVRHALRLAPNSTSAHIAELSHTSRVTARRYLEHLVDIGQAHRSPQHGSTGRPSSVYTATE